MSWLKRFFCRHRNVKVNYMSTWLTYLPPEEDYYVLTYCLDCDWVIDLSPEMLPRFQRQAKAFLLWSPGA